MTVHEEYKKLNNFVEALVEEGIGSSGQKYSKVWLGYTEQKKYKSWILYIYI